MENNETQRKRRYRSQKQVVNAADYIDIPAFIRTFLRLARRYLLLVFPIIICLTACISMLSRVLVKEQYVAEASFVVGVTLSDDFSYNYTLSTVRDDYVGQMSGALQAVSNSEYMGYLLEEELGKTIPGEIHWKSAQGTTMGGGYTISDSMENAVQLRDAVITCLPKAVFTTIGDIEIKVLETTERTEVVRESLKSPVIWVGAGGFGGIFAYCGIIFLFTLWRHDIENSEDMLKITNLPCLGTLTGSGKMFPGIRSGHARSGKNEHDRSFTEFEKQLAGFIKQKQAKTILFTGDCRKRGQTKLLDRINHDWISQGKKIKLMNMDITDEKKTGGQIREELNQQLGKAPEEADLVIINGPGCEQTVELLTIADCVDGIVYIVKAGYDQLEHTKEAISTLEYTQAELIGYVITA